MTAPHHMLHDAMYLTIRTCLSARAIKDRKVTHARHTRARQRSSRAKQQLNSHRLERLNNAHVPTQLTTLNSRHSTHATQRSKSSNSTSPRRRSRSCTRVEGQCCTSLLTLMYDRRHVRVVGPSVFDNMFAHFKQNITSVLGIVH